MGLAAIVLAAVLTLGRVSPMLAAESEAKGGETVRVAPDQMHQLEIVTVQSHPFRLQKAAVGQIAFNEDTSTVVLTPFSGRVTRLIARIGDAVRRGDPLFEIDSQEVVQPQNDYIAAVATVNKARVQLDLARIAEKRGRDLYEGQAGALKEWQQAQDKLVAAENDLRASESALDAANHRLLIIGRTQAEIGKLHGKGDINRTVAIQAPIDGTVVARRIGPGQFVRSDTGEALYTLADVSTMWLKAQVPETDIPMVRLGQELEVRVTALPGRTYRARVTTIGAASDMATHRVVVRSEIPNPDGALKAEMFALIKITTGDGETSPAVPVEAVIREPEASVVWVEREPMLFERRKVTLGIEQDNRLQIRDGLNVGDQVVGRGAIFIDNEWRQ